MNNITAETFFLIVIQNLKFFVFLSKTEIFDNILIISFLFDRKRYLLDMVRKDLKSLGAYSLKMITNFS